MCRQRGRIVLIGVTGLRAWIVRIFTRRKSPFRFRVPTVRGAMTRQYESRGIDYPFGLVRWTEQRNFEAVLQLDGIRRSSTYGR